MSDTQVYGASRIKRVRATKIQMDERRASLLTIVREIQPATVRQVFYQATVRGVVQKDEPGYARVQRELADMRREGVLPYDWVVDSTRWMRKPVTHHVWQRYSRIPLAPTGATCGSTPITMWRSG